MRILTRANPFGAPFYYFETISSTMDEARRLAAEDCAHGTVVAAGFQEAGRGRTPGRPWLGEGGKNLFFTIILRYPDYTGIPPALTLRVGLALSRGIEDFAPPLAGQVRVKWPNDIMIGCRKAAGVLTEGDHRTIRVGIGVNVGQTAFPEPLRSKAVSIAMALGEEAALPPEAPLVLLEKILPRLHRELTPEELTSGELDPGADPPGQSWREGLEERLYMKGERVRFMPGGAEDAAAAVVEGILRGVGPQGELLICPGEGSPPQAFVTGELLVY
jgi:BirA family biotin operon repressor/biotin-[acetyl-CoA-carboxylase] ligase